MASIKSDINLKLLSQLRGKCASIKRRLLAMHFKANSGHVGASLSCAEILTFVRFGWMGPDDDLVLSKGHAASALYSLLIEAGDLEPAMADSFYGEGTLLAAHPPPGKLPGIPFATGSLGHGLSLAAGMAMGDRLLGEKRRVFCVTSDGELNEGSIWEAALFIAHHRLNNVVWLVDRNGLQGFGRTEEVMGLEPLSEKLSAFGFEVDQANGHDFSALLSLRDRLNNATSGKPTVILCRTTKGLGLGKLEDTVDCHYLPLSQEQHAQALKDLADNEARTNA